MTIEAHRVPYGPAAAEALRAAVARHKSAGPLEPVSVVVPNNHVGVSARRLLGSGVLGAVSPAGVGLAAATFVTTHRLGELLGAPRLAAVGRRPVSTPVIAAAVRAALREQAGMFAPVAAHPTTERSLVRVHRELREVPDEGLSRLAAAGRRTAEVVRLHRAVTRLLANDWYDEVDLLDEAVAAVEAGSTVLDDLGPLVVHLPQILRPSSAALLRAYSMRLPVEVIAALVGDDRADAAVERALAMLDVTPATITERPPVPPLRLIETSDADDEVRHAVRVIVDAARRGVPLERMAVLHSAHEPYARTVHEQLAAAGIPHNGVAVQTVASSLLGRSLLALLALPDHRFRRPDVIGWLTSAPVRSNGQLVPSAAWDRVSRRAGVVSGANQWSARLERHAGDLRADADRIEADAEGRARAQRREADWADSLSAFVGQLVTDLDPSTLPTSWSGLADRVRFLVDRYFGGPTVRSDWPEVEQRAAERVDAALERLGVLDSVDGAADLAVFRRTLELELESGLGRVGRLGEGVLTGRLDMGLGLELDELIVVGMAEGTLPSRGREDSLLPDRDRALVDELTPRGERVDDEHRQLLAALAGAGHLTLLWPRGDLRRSVERVSSRWIDEILAGAASSGATADTTAIASFAAAITTVGFPATEQEYNVRSLAAEAQGGVVRHTHPDVLAVAGLRRGFEAIASRAGASFTRYDGNLAGAAVVSPTDPSTVMSPTRLEAWARCPFLYFMEHVLHVRPLDRPESVLQISALDRGNIVHHALEQLVSAMLERPPDQRVGLGRPWSTDDRALLRRFAEEECERFEARGLTGKAVYWKRDRARLLSELDRYLDHDDAARAARRSAPTASELTFGLGPGHEAVPVPLPDGRAIRFRGSADRVDLTASGGLVVIDYKTGSISAYRGLGPDDPDQGGRRLQLAVYGHAARAAFGAPGTPVEAGYHFVSARASFGWVGYELTDVIEERFGEVLTVIADGIGAGVFPAFPLDLDHWVSQQGPSADPYRLSTSECRAAWARKCGAPELAVFLRLSEPEVGNA